MMNSMISSLICGMIGGALFLGMTPNAKAAAAARAMSRYYVDVKDREVYAQIQSQFNLSREEMTLDQVVIGSGNADQAERPFEGLDLRVTALLLNFQGMVIQTNDMDRVGMLRDSPSIGGVEREVFHPAPQPIPGFRPVRPTDTPFSNSAFESGPAPGQPWGIEAVRAPKAWALGITGKGSRVLVLDTGVDTAHPAIARNFEKGRDFSSTIPTDDVTDKVGHGTHVSTTILGVR